MKLSPDFSFKSILENISFGVIQVDINGKVVYANPSAYDIIERNSEGFIGENLFDLDIVNIDQDGIPLSERDQPLSIVLRTKEIIESFVQGVIIKDKVKWFSINASPVFDSTGKCTGGISCFTEITERINIELQYKENAERNRLLIENVQAVFWEAEIGSLGFSYVSPKAEEMFGYPMSAWTKDRFWESIIFEEDRSRIVNLERRGEFQANNYELEYRVVKNDGSKIWIRDLVEVVKEGLKPKKLRGILINITSQKRAENELKSSESRYRELIKEAPYAITIYNRDGILIAANEKCGEIWLLDREKWIGSYNIFEDEEFKEQGFDKALKEAFAGKRNEFSSEILLPMTGGLKKHLHIKYYPLFDQLGEVENVVFVSEDVTDYVAAEENAKTGEALKQGILDALDEGILVVDKVGLIISINKSLARYAKNQTYANPKLGDYIFDFFEHFENKDILRKGLENILNGSSTFFDHELRLSDGRWYGLRITQLKSPFGAVISWQNINTRKEIELALEKSLKKYRSIYNTAPVMMHSVGLDRNIVSVSDFWLSKMEYERNEVIGQSPSVFMTDESRERFTSNIDKLFNSGFITANYQLVKKSGTIIDVILSAKIEYDETGNFERSIAGLTDITDLKAVERELVESRMNLLESQRLSKIGNYEFFVKSKAFESSSEMDLMMGFNESDRDLNVLQKLMHDSDREGFLSKLEDSMKTGKEFFHVYRINHLKNGRLRWISGRGRMIRNDDGEIVKMIGTVQDITDQKLIEEKIRKLTDRILLATEIAGIGVWEFDREKDKFFWEEQMYSIFGEPKAPITDLSQIKSMIHEQDRNVLEESIEMVKEGANFLEVECRVVIKEEIKYLRSFTRVIRDQDSRLQGMIGVFYDITHDKKLQLELENSLDEKNVLIKEVHHRVKNNMQLVSSILALKSYELKDKDSKKIFKEVNDRIKAMSIIHDKLYTFYNVSEINISEYLESIADELRILFGPEEIRIEVEADQVIFDVDKALTIGLIISEIVSNAVKHGFRKNKSGTINILFSEKNGKYHLIILNDGDEIPENTLKSTSGLGMSLVQTFVRQLRGNISIDQRNGFNVDF